MCLTVLLLGACGKPKTQIEPIIKEEILEKIAPPIPKDSIIIIKKIDSTIVKIDSVKIVIPKDSVKKEIIPKIVGDQFFEFYDITPPDISISFPSHSIVMIPIHAVGKELGVGNSFCEYWLYTKDGKLVCYCKNTQSGLHPIYGNSFNANNHLPQFTKKIGYGDYRLVYKNISKVPVRQDLIFGLILNQGKDQVDVKVDSGETKEFWIKIYPTETSHFKMNNNNKIPI